jgi:hypothetical protein
MAVGDRVNQNTAPNRAVACNIGRAIAFRRDQTLLQPTHEPSQPSDAGRLTFH